MVSPIGSSSSVGGVPCVMLLSPALDTEGSIPKPTLDIQTRAAKSADEGGEAQPVPVASLQLANGNTLEFYDFGSGALVSEVGDAYVTPAYEGKGKTVFDLVTTWQELSTRPVPPALTELQSRLTTPSEAHKGKSISFSKTTQIERTKPKQGAGGGNDLVSTLSWCGNGCCDYAWLNANVGQCAGGWDQNWFLYDYGYSYANWNDVAFLRTAACAASGTSTFTISVNGSGGTWSIPQGNLRTYNWDAAYDWFWCAGWCGEDMASHVNTATTQATHSYCGQVIFD